MKKKITDKTAPVFECYYGRTKHGEKRGQGKESTLQTLQVYIINLKCSLSFK